MPSPNVPSTTRRSRRLSTRLVPRPSLETKIQSAERLARALRRVQRRGQRVVFTNGCFDVLHVGHVHLLERASRLGDVLVVGLNSDASVRQLKGRGRPVMRAPSRARVLAALASVDYVTTFDASTPEQLIAKLKPDVLVKGADWSAKGIVGSDIVTRNGGRVVRIPLVKGHSTTKLISRLRRGSARAPRRPGRGRRP